MLVAVALYVRLHIQETPIFDAERTNKAPHAPLTDLVRAQPRELLLAAGCVVGIYALGFMAGTFLVNDASTELGYARSLILTVGVLGGLAMVGCTAASAILSDAVGRRRCVATAFALAGPWSFAVMPLMDSGSPLAFAVAIAGTYALVGVATGPMASFLPEVFPTRYRYTASGLSYNIGGILGGALPPLFAAGLLAVYGSWTIGALMAAMASVSLVCMLLMPETKAKPLSADESQHGVLVAAGAR